jgi:Fe-S-cluster containining protein
MILTNALPCQTDKCKSECCGIVPIPADVFERNRAKLQQPCKIIADLIPGQVIATGANLTCGFLSPDHKCVIYDERPDVCRKFGSVEETHEMLICPHKKAWAERGEG